jgi:DNA-binding MarR family transcriptional regulator
MPVQPPTAYPYGLTPAQHRVLAVIFDISQAGSITTGTNLIALRLYCTPSAVSRHLGALERVGLIERRRHQPRSVRLTPAAVQMVQTIRARGYASMSVALPRHP